MTAEEVLSNMADSNSLEDSDEYLTHYDVELYLKKNPEFTKKFVFNYLSNHLDFADEFFQTWYDNMIGLSLNRGGGGGGGGRSKSPASSGSGVNFTTRMSNDSAFFAEEDEEEENEMEGNEVYHQNGRHHSQQHSSSHGIGNEKNTTRRRRSDPITITTSSSSSGNNTTTSNNQKITNINNTTINGDINKKPMGRSGSEECLDTIDEDIVTRTERSSSMVLPKEAKYRTMLVDSNNNNSKILGTSIESLLLKSNTANATNNQSMRAAAAADKPHLRKAQSAPTYKKKLSNLIRSSVFSGSSTSGGGSKHINVENHTELRELNESHYIIEIIKDISKDMCLSKVCFKILVNLGFLLNIEKASIFIVHEESSISTTNNTTSKNTTNANNKDNKKSLKLLLDCVSIAKGVRKESLSSSLSTQPQTVPIGSGIIGHVAESGESLVVNSISSVSIIYVHGYRNTGEFQCH